MGKGIIIAIIIVVLGLGGYFVFFSGDDDVVEEASTSINQTETPQETTEPQTEVQAQTTESGEGQYIDYSEQAVADNAGKTKIIYFHAEWCPNCRALEKNILAGSIPSDIVILKADFDRESDLKKELGVTSQTTLVQVDDEGNKVNLWIGSAFDDIEAIKEELI